MGMIHGFRLGRTAWTVLVTAYFLFFFRNFFADAAPSGGLMPLLFAYAFVFWLAVEYYFGSPFFQSGVVESSPLWRGVFAFFVYPFLGYVAADAIWWHWTRIPLPAAVTWVPGMLVFAAGVYVRIDTLLAIVGLTRPRAGRGGGPRFERQFVRLRFQRMSRHPRYFATLLQLIGAALAFGSWGGLVLAAAVGFPLILLQVRGEDRRLAKLLKSEFKGYAAETPLFWPRIGR